MKTYFSLGAVLGVPLYAAYSLKKRVFSIERLLNSSTLAGFTAAGTGGLVEYSRNSLSDAVALKQRRVAIASSVPLRRQDDFATIGSVLGACLVSAIFWNRAGLLDLTAGGLSMGYGSGFLVHHVQTFLGNPAGATPLPELPPDDPRMRRR
ncbi:hypothetical protein C8F01DRAFT_1100141 [Mycena amicta]|nr:hypothetical protein C8F01DRAFT_1100141 [Mycena amicta]